MSIVGLDVDGCLANFNVSYAKIMKEVSGIDFPDFTKEEPPCWEYDKKAGLTSDQIKECWKIIKKDKRFWFNLLPLPQTEDFLGELDASEHEVYFITDRLGWMPQYQTGCWLQQFFTDPSVIISRRGKGKVCHALSIDYYIDDKVENIEDVWANAPLTQAYLLKKPYNKKLHGIDNVVTSLTEFKERTHLYGTPDYV